MCADQQLNAAQVKGTPNRVSKASRLSKTEKSSPMTAKSPSLGPDVRRSTVERSTGQRDTSAGEIMGIDGESEMGKFKLPMEKTPHATVMRKDPS